MKKFAPGLFAAICGLILLLVWLAPAPVQAAPQMQYTQFPTPTPAADGRILYLVQSGDTLYWIANVTGVSVDELRRLNNMDANDVLVAGTYILLGLVDPVGATNVPGSGQSTSSVQLTPTPTPNTQPGEICVLLYLDVNGNAIFEEGDEYGVGDGEVSVTERLGSYSQKGTTEFSYDPIEPLCFSNIAPGTYLVTMALPEGYNRTTELSMTIELYPGTTAYLNFGMQPNGDTISAENQQIEETTNTMIGVIGFTFLVGGIGLGIYSAVTNRDRF